MLRCTVSHYTDILRCTVSHCTDILRCTVSHYTDILRCMASTTLRPCTSYGSGNSSHKTNYKAECHSAVKEYNYSTDFTVPKNMTWCTLAVRH
jgi:hypothetical protein